MGISTCNKPYCRIATPARADVPSECCVAVSRLFVLPMIISAGLSDLNTISSGIKMGQAVNRSVIVGGQKLQYTVFRLPEGNLNAGRIHATK